MTSGNQCRFDYLLLSDYFKTAIQIVYILITLKINKTIKRTDICRISQPR